MRRPRAILLVALFAGTLAVRPQLTAVGPLLPEIQDDFGIDHATAGLLVTIPGSLFALAMTLSAAATDRPGEAAALASMQLGVGYTMAAAAPFALGALRDATGSFTAGLWVVAGISVLVAVFAATTIVLLGRRPTRVAQPPEEAAST